jgi:hypothetical protein
MTEQERVKRRKELNDELSRAIKEHGTQSIEYRRAVRRMYRFH